MNTGSVDRQYGQFTPAERVALTMAAVARGDDRDRRLLKDSAPLIEIRVPDSFAVSMALSEVTWQERAHQLELVARFYAAQVAAGDAHRDAALSARREAVVRLFAYLIGVHASGWRLFCVGRRITPEAERSLGKCFPGQELLEAAERAAAGIAFTADQVRSYLGERGAESGPVRTAESHAAELEAVYQSRFEFWDSGDVDE